MHDALAHLPEWRWTLRVFYSADLSGATALKYLAPKSWIKTITDFYAAFSVDLRGHVESAWKRIEGTHVPSVPKLWKGLGDELVFVQSVTSLEQVLASTAGFASAVRAHNRAVEETENRASRPVKATAWSAGFPLSNRVYGLGQADGKPGAVEVGGDSSADASHEYVGPNIDLGFRLCKYARHAPDRLVMSPDLAWLVLKALEAHGELAGEFRWLYEGREVFAGVRLGEPVPVVLLNLLDPATAPAEARLLKREEPECGAESLLEFLTAYIPRSDYWPRLPFIVHDARVRPSDADMAQLEQERVEARTAEEADSTNYAVEGTPSDQAAGDPDQVAGLPPMG